MRSLLHEARSVESLVRGSMSPSSSPLPRGNRGVVLIAVLLLVMVSLAIGLMSAISSRTEMQIAHNQVLDMRALAVAEAGLHDAKQRIAAHGNLNDELASFGTGACAGKVGGGTSSSGLSAIGSAAALATESLHCFRYSSFGGGGYFVRAEDNNDETAACNQLTAPWPTCATQDLDKKLRVVSHGIVGTAERIVAAILSYTPGGQGILLLGQSCSPCLKTGGSGGYIDSYTGTPPSATFGSDAKVRTNGPVNLYDNPLKGDLTTSGTLTGGPVTGTTTLGAPIVPYPSSDLPPVPTCSITASDSGISEPAVYDENPSSKSFGQFKMGSSDGTVTLAPGDYCWSGLEVTGGSILQITGKTTITILGGKMVVGGGGLANTTLDSTNLTINSTCSGKDCINSTGGSATYMQLYAPTGEAVVGGGGDFYGTVVALALEVTGGSRVHLNNNGSGGGTAVLSNWREVQN